MRSDWNVTDPDFVITEDESHSASHSLYQVLDQTSAMYYLGSLENLRYEYWKKRTAKTWDNIYLRWDAGPPANGYRIEFASNVYIYRYINGTQTAILSNAGSFPNSMDSNWHGYRHELWTEVNYVRYRCWYYETSSWELKVNFYDPIGSASLAPGTVRLTFYARSSNNGNSWTDDIKIESLDVTGP